MKSKPEEMPAKTPAELFEEYKHRTENLQRQNGGRFNAKGRKYFAFAQLEHIGIKTYKQLDTEMDAVATRTSKHSATNRNAIVSAYVMCNIDKITKDELPSND